MVLFGENGLNMKFFVGDSEGAIDVVAGSWVSSDCKCWSIGLKAHGLMYCLFCRYYPDNE